jgi:hypothetical protein
MASEPGTSQSGASSVYLQDVRLSAARISRNSCQTLTSRNAYSGLLAWASFAAPSCVLLHPTAGRALDQCAYTNILACGV